jgi:erythromycin esterase
MPDEDVVAALREHATALRSTAPAVDPADPETGSDAVDAVAGRLGEAAVVGLGEATHGTREFARTKHRLVERLVADQGFRTVAFEADVAAMLAADASVREGVGDPETTLGDLYRWPWQTAAVADLLAWLRTFNEDRPPEDRVRVRGVDLLEPSAPAAALVDRLRAVDVVAVPNDLATLAASDGPPAGDEARERYVTRGETAATAVRNRLEDRRDEHVAASSDGDWHRARHLARVVVQNCEWDRVRRQDDDPPEAGMTERDRIMAENVAWSHERDPGEGVVVWAHDGHVQRGRFDDGTAWTDGTAMGQHLADEFGDDYRAVGFDFGRGTVRARVRGEDDGPRAVTVDEPLDGSVTAHLDAVADADDGPDAPFVVDLAAAGDDPRLADLLADGRQRSVGSVYDPEADAGRHYRSTDLPAAFDWLCYVDESSPSRGLAE